MSEFNRKCPICNNNMNYSSKGALKTGYTTNSNCRKCASKMSGFTEKYILNNSGKNNQFYGKKHSQEAKNKQRNAKIGKKHDNAFKQKISKATSGSKNPMYGKKVFDIWVSKYGLEVALQKDIEWKRKISNTTSGTNSHRYGKPPSNGSGNGWSGWYKEWFFRSLRELSYVINVLEKQNKQWKSAENIRIKYISANNKQSTYSPDFLVDNYLIEIKPLKLQNSPSVLAKKLAAEQYCLDKNLTYIIIDTEILSYQEIRKLYESKTIKFTKRYEEKFKNYNPITGASGVRKVNHD